MGGAQRRDGVTAGLDRDTFDALFDHAKTSVFRWEAREQYAVPGDDARMVAFRNHLPRPERSVRTSPWLARIAAQTTRKVSPVDWARVRVIEVPESLYDRFSMLAYIESQAAGERILVIEPGHVESPDFWLIDGGTPDAVAVFMDYDDDGHLLARRLVDDPAVIPGLVSARDRALHLAKPLNVWLAEWQGVRA
jgi:hypothetical protein